MQQNTNEAPAARFDPGAATLWASAFVVMALIITQASRLGLGSAAYADVSEVGDITVLTAAARNDDDVLLVLDRRTESLSVYGIVNRAAIRTYTTQDLRDLFIRARANTR
jgi:hypothetical protein